MTAREEGSSPGFQPLSFDLPTLGWQLTLAAHPETGASLVTLRAPDRATPGEWTVVLAREIPESPGMWSALHVGDLDADGSPDIVCAWNSRGCGLRADIAEYRVILTDRAATRAWWCELGHSFGLEYLDVDRNGRAELLVRRLVECERCTDGKPHNFWVHHLVGIQGRRLVDLNATVPDFPRFEWLSFDTKDRFRPLLTPAMKATLAGAGLGLPPYARPATSTTESPAAPR